MAKKYQGKSMAKSSRFVAFLKTMDTSDLSNVEERIEFYIQDNKEYCDKGNPNIYAISSPPWLYLTF